ncbi:hypothetical protein PAXRUDRAFT_140684 [Paxillus rubicundulus Ve08.2h10]|uniref:Coiled-coil domain-containing protein 174 n=1 Tax=Paxillus rubicundulus Ve08.2h10 TaxID=930991 RepID=A0A0D0DRA7_9AGAM|nr:hypothetical protein PAXRUDRAFT_140684 [Paxillus rubicundulus Ve08.2h10]
MPPSDKAKAAGVSVTSFFDLKAELAKKSDEFAKNKAAGGPKYVAGQAKRPEKKPTVWARSNRGVQARSARDVELEEVSKVTVESARAALERKAKVYEKLRKGKSGGLSEKQYSALLVDFDSKDIDHYSSDSDDVDESLTVPTKPGEEEDDPIIEYEDEFGRLRTSRRSEVPRHLLPRSQNEDEVDDADVIHNPVGFYPVYEPSAERIQAVEEEFAEAENPLSAHYDASKEVRAKGAAFYQFSADEETRKQQMEELRVAREETRKTREDMGALDVQPGEVEGLREEGESSGSRALAKRKREIENRRALLEAKRRKAKTEEVVATGSSSTSTAPPTSLVSRDPFATLEQVSACNPHAPKPLDTRPANYVDADSFLAQLEQDMSKKRK